MISNNITAIVSCPDKKGYADIYADGELILTISEDAVIEAGLHVGDEVNPQRLEEIEFSVSLTKAKSKAYNYLSYGDMSKDALYKKLVRYGFCQEVASKVCDGLEEAGYIDDERYALSLAGYYANTKLYGPRRIIQEMSVKGIGKEMAQEAVLQTDADFEQNIQTLVNGKFRRDLTDRKEVSKLFAALVRYGYDYDMIGSALSDLEEQYE